MLNFRLQKVVKKAGMYLLEGEHLVEEAVKENAPIELIVVSSNRLEDYQLLLSQTNAQLLVVSQERLPKVYQ